MSLTFSCPLCAKEFEKLISLSQHYRKHHKKTAKELVVTLFYNGIEPTCVCGCGEEVEYVSLKRKFKKYKQGHYKTKSGKIINNKKDFPQKISFKEAQKKFANKSNIILCEDGYNGWRHKAKFLNTITNEYFWEKPENVYKSNYEIYRRFNIISLEEAKKLFSDQGRDGDIKIIGSTYVMWTKKAKFLDLKINKTWWATPKDVYNRKSYHPSRKSEVTMETCLKLYNVENPSQYEPFKEKLIKTNLEKLGVKYPGQSKAVQEKIKETNLVRYNEEVYFKSDDFKSKYKETCLRYYNVDHYSKTDEFKIKFTDTLLRDYNVTNPMKLKFVQIKAQQTNFKKYGFKHYSQTKEHKKSVSNRWIIENDMFLKDWYELQSNPKPAYVTLVQHFSNEEISLKDLEEFCRNYKESKTYLELFAGDLFKVEHYNRKPKEISKNYRPDFKLSDKIYLNVDGLYWHCELQKDKWHHYNLRKEFEDNGLRLFQFYDYEIYNKSNIVKSIVNSSIGNFSNEINANDCNVSVVIQEKANFFLAAYDLKGLVQANHIGLYYNNKLVSIMSYNLCGNNICIIDRLCSLLDTNIIDNSSVFLSYLKNNFLNDNITKIYYWIDLRYEQLENCFLNNGFSVKKDCLGYCLTDKSKTYTDIFDSNSLYKIWDAGQRLYIHTN